MLISFFSGSSAGPTVYQAYLLEGIVRWNEARFNAKLNLPESSPHRVFDTHLRHLVNSLSKDLSFKPCVGKGFVDARSLCQGKFEPAEYTGEFKKGAVG